MIIECPRCKSRYDSSLNKPGDQIACRCGQQFYTPKLPNLAQSWNCPNCGGGASPNQTSCNYCGVVLSFARCPSCFSLAPYQGAKFCAECGDSLSTPAKVASEANKDFSCPRCKNKDLERKSVDNYTVDNCLYCGGVWLDHHVLDKTLVHSNKQANSQALLGKQPVKIANLKRHKVSYLPCPECDQLMHRRNFAKKSGIIVDECTAHGVWFDKSELAAAIHFARSSLENVTHDPLPKPGENVQYTAPKQTSPHHNLSLTGNDLEFMVDNLIKFLT